MNEAMTADRRDFTRALTIAASVADRRSTVPILQTVKITANGKLRIEATDLDMAARVDLDYAGPAQPPFALRGAPNVLRALKQVGGETVDLAFAGEGQSTRVDIASGSLSAQIATHPVDCWPDMNAVGVEEFGCELGGDVLTQIARVMPAMSTEETRYYLNGICIEQVGEWLFRFVATDGHRLMVVDVPLPGFDGAIPARTIIPSAFVIKLMQHFAKAKGPVKLSYGRGRLANGPDADLAPEVKGAPRITFGGKLGAIDLALTSKLIDGKYPDYTRVIPERTEASLSMKRADLLAAVRALTPLTTMKLRAVKLEAFAGAVRVSLACPDLGDSRIDIEAEHAFADGYKIAGFNGAYLVDCLAGFTGEEVSLSWARETSPSEPCVIRDPADTAFFCVLMPMRV